MSLQITFINKPGGSHNPAARITQVGGAGWWKWSSEVIADILNDRETYIVSQAGITVGVGIGIHNGYYYLRTRSDGTPIDNLLSLTNIANN